MKDKVIPPLCSLERFLSDVRTHQMAVEHDDGVYRSVRFARPGTSAYHFVLTSWPGHIAMSGDMGSLVLSRVRDMFAWCDGSTMRVDMHYWHEKAVATSARSDPLEYDERLFEQAVRDDFRLHGFRSFRSARAVWNDVKDDLLECLPEHQHEAVARAMSFRAETDDGDVFEMPDFWETRLRSFSFGFIWQCYAIRWGARRYWQHKAGSDQAQHDRKVLAAEA